MNVKKAMSQKLIAGFGEVMLRLSPPEKKRFAQALPGCLEATFGGGEANVCASLALLGSRSRYLTALPDNPVATAFAVQLRGLGVEVDRIKYADSGRIGVYYAEHGADQRGANVVYDRAGSVIAELPPEAYDFAAMLDGVDHLHISGITPAISRHGASTTLELVKQASARQIKISCDLNFRKKLWHWEEGTPPGKLAERWMGQIVALTDWLICNEEDAADVFGIAGDGCDVGQGKLDAAKFEAVAARLLERFPRLARVAITLRESRSASCNGWGAMLYERSRGRGYFAPLDADGNYRPYRIENIVDRFGGGDSFAAALIDALYRQEFAEPQIAVAFAAAASCLKHTIYGDYNYVSRDEVMQLMRGAGSGRVTR